MLFALSACGIAIIAAPKPEFQNCCKSMYRKLKWKKEIGMGVILSSFCIMMQRVKGKCNNVDLNCNICSERGCPYQESSQYNPFPRIAICYVAGRFMVDKKINYLDIPIASFLALCEMKLTITFACLNTHKTPNEFTDVSDIRKSSRIATYVIVGTNMIMLACFFYKKRDLFYRKNSHLANIKKDVIRSAPCEMSICEYPVPPTASPQYESMYPTLTTTNADILAFVQQMNREWECVDAYIHQFDCIQAFLKSKNVDITQCLYIQDNLQSLQKQYCKQSQIGQKLLQTSIEMQTLYNQMATFFPPK